MKKSWKGETIVFSGVTDCYQPLESCYELTRKCLQVCAEFKNPVAIITKGALIRRDIDVLRELNQCASAIVYHSIAFSDDKMAKEIEPFAPRPSTRFRAMEELAKAGIPVAIGVAPVICALNDNQIPEILKMAKDCGAEKAFLTLLRLPLEVKEVFLNKISESYPTRYNKIVNQLKDMKGGALNRAEFGKRMKGEGPRWDAIKFLFNKTCQELGLNEKSKSINTSNTFSRSTKQLNLNI